MITKNLLKKVGLLMCAGVLFFDGLAMAGCAKNENVDSGEDVKTAGQELGIDKRVYTRLLASDMFILVDDVLYKGDVLGFDYYAGAGAGGGFGVTALELDCDEYIVTNDFKAYKKNEPKKEL